MSADAELTQCPDCGKLFAEADMRFDHAWHVWYCVPCFEQGEPDEEE